MDDTSGLKLEGIVDNDETCESKLDALEFDALEEDEMVASMITSGSTCAATCAITAVFLGLGGRCLAWGRVRSRLSMGVWRGEH
jgi:hypothetical protein